MTSRPAKFVRFCASATLLATTLAGGMGLAQTQWTRVAASSWRVTRGTIAPLPSSSSASSGGAEVREPVVRAVAPGSDGSAARLRFTYRGPSASAVALASGQLRRQVGLKLRAQDGCNLLYAMWRIEPRAELVVSVKRNPGAHTHRECGARGYRNLTPATSAPLPALVAGVPHELAATLAGHLLTVRVDGAAVWTGDVGDAETLRGPAGWRSDNVAVDLALDAVRGDSQDSGSSDED